MYSPIDLIAKQKELLGKRVSLRRWRAMIAYHWPGAAAARRLPRVRKLPVCAGGRYRSPPKETRALARKTSDRLNWRHEAEELPAVCLGGTRGRKTPGPSEQAIAL